jgi:hypothetical protein
MSMILMRITIAICCVEEVKASRAFTGTESFAVCDASVTTTAVVHAAVDGSWNKESLAELYMPALLIRCNFNAILRPQQYFTHGRIRDCRFLCIRRSTLLRKAGALCSPRSSCIPLVRWR